MIHTIIVDSTTKPDELRKLFRKKLMTGGAVVRLAPGLSPEQIGEIGREFLPGVVENNLNAMVLAELAKYPDLPENLAQELEKTELGSITRALKARGAK